MEEAMKYEDDTWNFGTKPALKINKEDEDKKEYEKVFNSLRD